MSLVRDQADWIRLCRLSRLSDEQQVLLETVIAACDPDAILTRQVACTETAVAAIARGHSALESRARPNRKQAQPYPKATRDLISAARTALESTMPVFLPGSLNEAIRTLSDIEADGEPGLIEPADCHAAATRVAAAATDVRTAVIDHFTAAWQGNGVGDSIDRLALEMAALCAMEGRWHPRLSGDVRAALSSQSVDGEGLSKILLPTERAFRVAVVVEGASRLKSLAALMDPAAEAAEIEAGEPPVGRGLRAADLKALADIAKAASVSRHDWSGNQPGGYVLLTFTVRACDLGRAALLGRRQVSEVLDQYVAGQRVSEIRLRPESLAQDLSSRRVLRLTVPVLGSSPARPLTASWPPMLRESLRTAHIARVTEAPMTVAGLCWAALEALEVKTGTTGELARALSLQALRQQAMELHQRMRTVVVATVRASARASDIADGMLRSLDAVAAGVEGGNAALNEKVMVARAVALDERAALDRATEHETYCVMVDAWANVGDDGKLRDLNRWLDVLAASAGSAPTLRAAVNAVIVLADHLGGETGARLRTWRALLAEPESLAGWIEDSARRFKEGLDWLYALRNTALHDGRFASKTDMLDAHAGCAFVDLTLEFLGNWYGQGTTVNPERAAWTAIKVIHHLAERQQFVVAKLRAGVREGLNVTHLTSPTSNGWDRP